VVVADYPLLRKDFPEALAKKTDAEINVWLLDHAAYISQAQYEQGQEGGVNSSIRPGFKLPNIQDLFSNPDFEPELSAKRPNIQAYRPREYGRALVIQVPGGLMELKGAGFKQLASDARLNGLLRIEDALTEYVGEKYLNKALSIYPACYQADGQTDWELDLPLDTIQYYAVFALGFLVESEDYDIRKSSEASLLLRQAHIRSLTMSEDRSLFIESHLKKLGVSSYFFSPEQSDSLRSKAERLSHEQTLRIRRRMRGFFSNPMGSTNLQGQIANGLDGDAITDFGSYYFPFFESSKAGMVLNPDFIRLSGVFRYSDYAELISNLIEREIKTLKDGKVKPE
jgi:hypothetical protein